MDEGDGRGIGIAAVIVDTGVVMEVADCTWIGAAVVVGVRSGAKSKLVTVPRDATSTFALSTI